MALLMGHQIHQGLLEALGLPEQTTWLEIRIAVGEIVTVKCGYAPNAKTNPEMALRGEQAIEVLKNYVVYERPLPENLTEGDRHGKT